MCSAALGCLRTPAWMPSPILLWWKEATLWFHSLQQQLEVMVKDTDSEAYVPALPPTSCVTLGFWLLSLSRFPHLKNGDVITTHFMVLLYGLNELTYAKYCTYRVLDTQKCSISISCSFFPPLGISHHHIFPAGLRSEGSQVRCKWKVMRRRKGSLSGEGRGSSKGSEVERSLEKLLK